MYSVHTILLLYIAGKFGRLVPNVCFRKYWQYGMVLSCVHVLQTCICTFVYVHLHTEYILLGIYKSGLINRQIIIFLPNFWLYGNFGTNFVLAVH